MTRNAVAGLVAATRTPPIAGPANDITLSIVDETVFEAVSSSGVPATDGSNAAWAGRKAVLATDMALTIP